MYSAMLPRVKVRRKNDLVFKDQLFRRLFYQNIFIVVEMIENWIKKMI